MLAIINTLLVPPALAMGVTVAALLIFTRSRVRKFMLDHPNQRSLHSTPTPRLGGFGIALGIGTAWWYSQAHFDGWLIVVLAALTLISLIDDARGMPVLLRLAFHLTAALVTMFVLVHDLYGLWLTLTAALAVTWMTNLYNFMDGADGLAGGMAVFGFGAYGIAAAASGDIAFAAAHFSIAAASAGFLVFNFPPARIFLGDAGSIPLGFLAAVIDFAGWLRADWPLWFGVVVFSPFIADATVTLMKRLARGERVWQAHREHYYQRLVRRWGHRKTALAEYAVMAAAAGTAFLGLVLRPWAQFALLLGVTLVYAAFVVVLERKLDVAA